MAKHKCSNPECGNIAKRGKYCSHACYGKSCRVRPDKECPTCKKMFRMKRPWDIYCSRPCAYAGIHYGGSLSRFRNGATEIPDGATEIKKVPGHDVHSVAAGGESLS